MEYIIGIGANIGDIIENINNTIKILSSHKDLELVNTSSLYGSKAVLKHGAPRSWDINYVNAAIKIKTDLNPLNLLTILKFIEQNIGRDIGAPQWSPRVIDLDILAAENSIFHSEKLNIPHAELLNRSFALAPLLEIEPNWKHPSFYDSDLYAKLETLDGIVRLEQKANTTMRMGIVNLSDQSFSDGHFDENDRKSNLFELIDNGAEIIDIGAESTKPNAKPISTDEEFNKLDSFLDYLKTQLPNMNYRPLISIDTRKTEVLQKILEKYNDIVWMINDVECNDIKQKAKLIAKYNKKYVITHNLGIIDRDQYLAKDNAIDKICDYFNSKKNIFLAENVKQSNIYFDVGFGFGKQSETARYLLDNIENITTKVKLKSLVGHSRKSSVLGINKTASIVELDKATKLLSEDLIKRKIDIIRVHKV